VVVVLRLLVLLPLLVLILLRLRLRVLVLLLLSRRLVMMLVLVLELLLRRGRGRLGLGLWLVQSPEVLHFGVCELVVVWVGTTRKWNLGAAAATGFGNRARDEFHFDHGLALPFSEEGESFFLNVVVDVGAGNEQSQEE